MKNVCLLIIVLVAVSNLFAQPFVVKDLGIAKLNYIVKFVDIDRDGDLDIPVDSVWINNGGTFTKTNFAIPQYRTGDWGDYDNDGDMDLISGTYLYRNDGSYFTQVSAGFPSLSSAFSAWGDYDNDGQLDLVMMGSSGPGQSTYIFHNNNGVFTNINAGLPGMCSGSASWGDFDKDGDLDLLLNGGSYDGYNQWAYIYKNENGVFTNISAGLTCNSNSEPSLWSDFDNDGDLDAIVENKIYQNNDGVFSLFSTPFINYPNGMSCGDYDNDGDLDLISINIDDATKIYNNNSGNYTDISAGINLNGPILGGGGISLNLTSWGDYDNDGDLDVLISGTIGMAPFTKIYDNNTTTENTVPNVPDGLTATVNGNSITFKWNPATDNETPSAGLSYNLFVGTSPMSSDLYPVHADIATGKRYIPFRGMIQDTTYTLTFNNLITCTDYYWSVQAIDAGLSGSPFAPVHTFKLPLQIEATGNGSITCGESIELNVNTDFSGPLTYQWSDSGSLSDPAIQNPVASPEASILYYVTVTDGSECIATDSVSVQVNELTVNAGSDVTFSCGNSTQLNASVNSSSLSVNYSWIPSATLDNEFVYNPVASPSDTTYYVVNVTDGTGCHNSDTIMVVPTIANIDFPEICMVGTDPVMNKNMIIWEKPVTSLISDFIVYKESVQADVYTEIDTLQYNEESISVDPNSNPDQMAYRYKIASVDVCGNKSVLSNYHKTIHLTVNQGLGSDWNLLWSPYEGFSFPTYNIYRGNSFDSMNLIAQVQSNLYSYTDDPGSGGDFYYQIEAVNPNPCNTGNKAVFASSKSNVVNIIVDDIFSVDNQDILFYPNPASEKLTINAKNIQPNAVICISSMQGKNVAKYTLSNEKTFNVNLAGIEKGIYVLSVSTETSVVNKMLVIK